MRGSKAIIKVPDVNAAQRLLNPMIRATRYPIRTDVDYLQAGEWMKRADAFLAGPVVQFFVQHAIDAGRVHKQAVFARDQVRRKALEVKRIFGEKRVAYRTRKEAAAAKIRTRREEKLRLLQLAETKKVAREMAQNGDVRGANMLLKSAKNAPAPSLPATAAVPAEEGFVETNNYEYEIETPEKVPAKYWVIDESLIRSDVNTFGMDADIPGVRVWEVKKEHTRKGKR
jgi:hypothetical protein